MERRGGHCGKGKPPPPLPPPPRRAREERRQTSSGSFSASLLDAIYRSLDEGVDGDERADVGVIVDAPRRRSEELTVPPQFWWAKEAGGNNKPRQAAGGADNNRRRRETGVPRPRHSGYASSTASSSDSSASSSHGFTCSSASTTDTECTTATRRRHSPQPPPRVVVEEPAVAAADEGGAKPNNSKRKSKSRPCFPGARFRPRSPSSSPATFACALKALFTSARLQRKPKAPSAAAAAHPPPPPISPAPPQISGATSVASSTARAAVVPEPADRSVRFRPDAADASVVVRRRVEELVRSLDELEEDEEGSDASSDLFELESLRGTGADELPVYGTTSIAANRAIAQRAAAC